MRSNCCRHTHFHATHTQDEPVYMCSDISRGRCVCIQGLFQLGPCFGRMFTSCHPHSARPVDGGGIHLLCNRRPTGRTRVRRQRRALLGACRRSCTVCQCCGSERCTATPDSTNPRQIRRFRDFPVASKRMASVGAFPSFEWAGTKATGDCAMQ